MKTQPNPEITIRRHGGVAIVDIEGPFASNQESEGLREIVFKLLAIGSRQVLINLAAPECLDSASIVELVVAYVNWINAGGEMKIIGPTMYVRQRLKEARLSQVFETYDDERAAVQSFSKPTTISGSVGAEYYLG